MSETIEKWSTLKDVQEHLGVGRDTILQWIVSVKNAGSWYLKRITSYMNA